MREHISNRVSAAFTDAGAQQLKNITEPVPVYRLGPRSPELRSKDRPHAGETPALQSAVPALALSDKSSEAVPPLTNMSADPEQEFFADGLAEDVITALSRYRSLFVTAGNSSFTYKAAPSM